MIIIKYIFWIFWKSWFYILNLILLIVLLPFLLLFTANKQWYNAFYWVARHLWATPVLYGMGFFPSIRYGHKVQHIGSTMLVANHYSMTDIMLMFYCSKQPFVFVGKAELAKLPIFGYFYKKVAILVDRRSPQSRKEVYIQALQRINDGQSICIFPEGGVPEDESIVLDNFKDGAFRIAIECQIPIIPMVFHDTKKRFPFRFFAGSIGRMRVDILPAIATQGKTFDDKDTLREEVRSLILQKLIAVASAPHTYQ